MRYVMTAKNVAAAEAEIIASGVDVERLVEKASAAIVEAVCSRFDKNVRVAVFCGLGGNGGDGLLAAAMLGERGYKPTVYMIAKPQSKHVRIIEKIDRARSAGVRIVDNVPFDFDGADVVIDAMFGIGLNRPLDGGMCKIIDNINCASGYKIAVDIPSGLNADSGEIMGACVTADETITFTCYKPGMLFGAGRDKCGIISVADVGVPAQSGVTVSEDGDFVPYKRKASAHKGDAGRVYIIGGSGSMIGAPILAATAAHAALLNGAGLVTVCLPEIQRVACSARCVMAMPKFVPDTRDGFIRFDRSWLDEVSARANAVDIGMGMGATPDLYKIIEYLCENFGGTLVIDADALRALAGKIEMLSGSKPNVIITPHVGEFTAITGKPATIDNAMELARKINGVAVVKSATTIITDGKATTLNISGTPAMAKGGTGDVLGGCIAALSCAYSPFDAAVIACYRNGLGAERAVSSYAQMMLTPKQMLKFADYDEI